MAPLNDKQLLHKVSLLLTAFRAANPIMTIQTAHTLLLVAIHPGASVSELSNISGYKLSTISRNLLDLGSRNRKREPGLGLVSTEVDPNELRKKQVNLSSKGQALMHQLLDTMRT